MAGERLLDASWATSSYPPTREILTYQLYGPTPGKWALCSSASGRGRRVCPARRRGYPPRGRTPTRRPPPPPLCAHRNPRHLLALAVAESGHDEPNAHL